MGARKYIVLLFYFLWLNLHGDLETLPFSRTQRYPLKDYHQIVVVSVPRTGSSLVYNVFRYLFEKEKNFLADHYAFDSDRKVLKTHNINEVESAPNKNTFYIATIRNPIDASISSYRIRKEPIEDMDSVAKGLITRQRGFFESYEKLKKYGNHIQLLRYEDFEDDFDYLFKFVEEQLSITIAEVDKELLKTELTKEKIASSVEHFNSFKKYLPSSGFHGNHIAPEGYIPPQEFLDLLSLYYSKHELFFKKYDY